MKDKVVQNNSQVKSKKTKVEDHHRISSISNKTKSVTACNDSLKVRTSNVNVVCVTCGKCVFNSNHDACVPKFINDVNARTKKPKLVPISTRKSKSQANKFVATPHKKTGNDLLTGSRGYDLHTISLQETSSPTPICFLAKASPTQACKVKRSTFKTKIVPSSKGRLNLLHMDLCGPMRIERINRKKYILVIVDNYSRYTWTLSLRTKDETPEVLKDFLKMIQRNLQAQVINVRTDRGTEFLNKTLHSYFKKKALKIKLPLLEHLNKTALSKDRTVLSLRLLEQCF
ncbi:retrovirus-related pol polyprotein from transposon TNT 1-94 [Tanacetum coccineum]